MIGRGIQVASITLALVATAASASPDQTEESSVRESRAAMMRFATCIVTKFEKPARKYLSEPMQISVTDPVLRIKAMPDCLAENEAQRHVGAVVSIKMAPTLIRGALYESLYILDFKNGFSGPNFADVPIVDYAVVAGADDGGEVAKYKLMMEIGDCVVRSDPVGVIALLKSSTDSQAETTAVGGLVPSIQSCVARGSPLKISRSIIRGMVSEPIYRLTIAKQKASNAQG